MTPGPEQASPVFMQDDHEGVRPRIEVQSEVGSPSGGRWLSGDREALQQALESLVLAIEDPDRVARLHNHRIAHSTPLPRRGNDLRDGLSSPELPGSSDGGRRCAVTGLSAACAPSPISQTKGNAMPLSRTPPGPEVPNVMSTNQRRYRHLGPSGREPISALAGTDDRDSARLMLIRPTGGLTGVTLAPFPAWARSVRYRA